MKTKPKTYGNPGKNSVFNDWIKYSRALNNLDKDIIKNIDTILIDGRFRVACALNCFNVIRNNTFVLFDDFLNRKHYHIVLDYYDIIDKAGRLVVLQKKKVSPPNSDLIKQYENDSR